MARKRASRSRWSTPLFCLLGLLLAANVSAAESLSLASSVLAHLDPDGTLRLQWHDAEVLRVQPQVTGGRLSQPSAWKHHILNASEPVASVSGSTGEARLHAPLRFEAEFGRLEADVRAFAWPYFHLDDIVFLTGNHETPPRGVVLTPSVQLEATTELQRIEFDLLPHHSVGSPPRVTITAVETLVTEGDRTLWLGVVSLDRDVLQMDAESRLSWDSESDAPWWPLAIVTAPTHDVLRYNMGQAFLTYAGPRLAEPEKWQVPALCQRCRDPRLDTIEARITPHDQDLELELTWDATHVGLSPHGFRIGPTPLRSYLQSESQHTARFLIPEGDELHQWVRQRAHLSVTALTRSGQRLAPGTVRVTRDPRLPELASGTQSMPSHLSPRLVEAWPNPFHARTTLRIQVPTTLGQAFDFEAAGVSTDGMDLNAAPPFGTQPTVTVRIYNVSGQLIRQLYDSNVTRGDVSVSWDGVDEQGRPVAAGAYYVSVAMGDHSVTRRVLRLKP